MQTLGKVTSKKYKCQGCGHESAHETNHYGEVYTSCKNCSWKSPDNAIMVHECQEPLPEGWARPEPWKICKLGDVVEIVRGGVK